MRTIISEFDQQWESGLTPDVEAFVRLRAPLSVTELAQLLLVDQSHHWSRGELVTAAEYFHRFPSVRNCAETAVDLLFAEFLLREEAENHRSIEEFIEPYPELASEFRSQIEFHRTIEREPEELPTSADNITRSDSRSSWSPERLPGYTILRELGRGGLGVVYLAHDERLNRPVALKMLLAGRLATGSLLKRLMIEAEATARLQHSNIVQIYDVGQHDGRLYLALEYISGGTLADWMARQPQSPRDAARIIRDVALAIHFAHEKGVIHRDLKPSNLLIQPLPTVRSNGDGTAMPPSKAPNGEVRGQIPYDQMQLKIADFGLAKLIEAESTANAPPHTLTGDLMGTVAYMAPEQARGDAGKANKPAAFDIYSLGAILYELLTGRPPFAGVRPLEVLNQVLTDEPVRPSQLVRSIPRDLQTICLKCLEKNPERRYGSAAELADDIERFLSNQPIKSRHTSLLERGLRWCRRNPVKTSLVALAATLLLTITSLSGVYTMMLGHQLALSSQSEKMEKELKTQALELALEARLAQADALRTSRRIGQRFESLKAIEEARELGDRIALRSAQIEHMRNATIAALALPDMRVERRWKQFLPSSALIRNCDQRLTKCFCFLPPNQLVIHRLGQAQELARIDDVQVDSVIEISADGSRLAIIDANCRVYKVDTAEPTLLFQSTSSGRWSLTADGQQIIGSDDEGTLKLVDLDGSNSAKTIGHFITPEHIAISPDKERVAMWLDGSIQVLELGTGETTLEIHLSPVVPYQAFDWHPSSRILAVAGEEGGIELWEIGGNRLKEMPTGGPEWFRFDSTGTRLLVYNVWNCGLKLFNVCNGQLEFSQKAQQSLWLGRDTESGFNLLQSTDHVNMDHVKVASPSVYQSLPAMRRQSHASTDDISYSPDGRWIAYANRDELEIFDANTFESLFHTELTDCYVRFDSNQSLLTMNKLGLDEDGYSRRTLRRWKVEEFHSGQTRSPRRIDLHFIETVMPAQIGLSNAPFEVARDGRAIAIGRHDGLQIWSSKTADFIPAKMSHNDVRRVSVSPDGRQVASGGWNGGEVRIWDTDTGQLQRTMGDPNVTVVQFSPNGKLLAIASLGIEVWDTQTWQLLNKFKVDGQASNGVSICFSPDSQTLAVSDSYGRVHLMEPQSGRERLLLTGLIEKQILGMCYKPDGTQLAVLSAAETVDFWNLDVIQSELKARNLE